MARCLSFLCVLLGVSAWVQSVAATPNFLPIWESVYPTSTLPARMVATTGSACNVCHDPPAPNVLGNCYRTDLITLLQGGASEEDAIIQLDGVDSDGDGVANGEEATMPRNDQPGEVGYSMGLVGPTGTDPCSLNPGAPVSNELETPPTPIPAVSEWGMVAMTLLVLAVATIVFRSSPGFSLPVTGRNPHPVEFRP